MTEGPNAAVATTLGDISTSCMLSEVGTNLPLKIDCPKNLQEEHEIG